MIFQQAFSDLLPASEREYERSESLAQDGYWTEAALRLGRAVEASLYEVASAANILLTDTIIAELQPLIKSLKENEVQIIRNFADGQRVRRLAKVALRLSEAIADLTADPNKRSGIPKNLPRQPESLLREISQSTGVSFLKNNLESEQATLREILKLRNNAAHADLNGEIRELSESDYEHMKMNVNDFLGTMCRIMIGIKAGKERKAKVNYQNNIPDATYFVNN